MTTDEMKMQRDGQLAYGPAWSRVVVEQHDENRTVVARYRLATIHHDRSDPTMRRIGGHDYVLMTALSYVKGKGNTLTINDHMAGRDA